MEFHNFYEILRILLLIYAKKFGQTENIFTKNIDVCKSEASFASIGDS